MPYSNKYCTNCVWFGESIWRHSCSVSPQSCKIPGNTNYYKTHSYVCVWVSVMNRWVAQHMSLPSAPIKMIEKNYNNVLTVLVLMMPITSCLAHWEGKVAVANQPALLSSVKALWHLPAPFLFVVVDNMRFAPVLCPGKLKGFSIWFCSTVQLWLFLFWFVIL